MDNEVKIVIINVLGILWVWGSCLFVKVNICWKYFLVFLYILMIFNVGLKRLLWFFNIKKLEDVFLFIELSVILYFV